MPSKRHTFLRLLLQRIRDNIEKDKAMASTLSSPCLLHVASRDELDSIVGQLEALLENQLESDGWKGGDFGPDASDMDTAGEALREHMATVDSYPAEVDLDCLMGAAEKLMVLGAVEQLQEMGSSWIMHTEGDRYETDVPFTARIENYNGTPRS